MADEGEGDHEEAATSRLFTDPSTSSNSALKPFTTPSVSNGESSHGTISVRLSLSPINLPSVRDLGISSTERLSPTHHSTASMIHSTNHPVEYTHQTSHSPGYANPIPHHNTARYPVMSPDADTHMTGIRSPKKDIKRRTKTGCLTCRKRRIKCDEEHPSCRNCQKSKRECQGYDPVFKATHGPPHLQPAPASPLSGASSTMINRRSLGPSSSSTGNPTSATAYSTVKLPPMSTPSSTISSLRPFEFGSSGNMSRHHSDASTSVNGGSHSTITESRVQKCGGPIELQRLFWITNITPPLLSMEPTALEPEVLDEIKSVYINEFAPGLNQFFETKWYSNHGLEKLITSRKLTSMMAALIIRYKTVVGGDYQSETACRVQEMNAVWELSLLCRMEDPSTSTANGIESVKTKTTDHEEATRRLRVVEALLTKSTTPSNPVSQLSYSDSELTTEKKSEIQFWHAIGDFVSLELDTDANAAKLDGILNSARSSLNRLENRDVIYSILVTRHLGRRIPGFPDCMLPLNHSAGEADDAHKVALAREFISVEANWKGTTHPIQRLCDMAIRSWSLH